jgi:hypothetical protein
MHRYRDVIWRTAAKIPALSLRQATGCLPYILINFLSLGRKFGLSLNYLKPFFSTFFSSPSFSIFSPFARILIHSVQRFSLIYFNNTAVTFFLNAIHTGLLEQYNFHFKELLSNKLEIVFVVVVAQSKKPKLTAVGIHCSDHATPSIL